MLKSIKKIKKFGIFGDYAVDPSFNEFCRFNLFYGWNGSGKTTLSRLFGMLDKKLVDPAFTDCEFEIVSDNSVLKNSNLASYNTRVFVFNQMFIEENIDWKTQGAKTIVVISEDKIVDRKRYFDLKDVLIPGKQVLQKAAQDKYNNSVKERDDFLSERAKAIKQSFQFIDTTDARYMNYDRTKIRTFIESHQKELADPASILSKQQLEEVKKKIQPIHKPAITINFELFNGNAIVKAEGAIAEMLSAQVVNHTIQRLKENEDINNWVHEGLILHETHTSERCEYCGQAISDERLSRLQDHFSEAYIQLLDKLRRTKEWLTNLPVVSEFADAANIYDEFKDEYSAAIVTCKLAEQSLLQRLNEWKNELEVKAGNVFASDLSITTGVHHLLNNVEQARQNVNAIVSKHNKKSTTFETQLKADKERIELHFVSEAVKEKGYYKLLEKIDREQEKVESASSEVHKLVAEKTKLEGELANVQIGADNFNAELHKFLGRKDISLQYDAAAKGYKIVRTGTTSPAKNLSEGEKTAIAFVYFTIKLQENGNRVKESIVVVDDPISSFDSNYLFHSFSYLKNTCGDAAQLFVLTHNFQYFRLVRDWMLGKNKSNKPTKAQVYSIDVLKKDPRQSIINNAHASLLNHNSEYQFFFRKLHSFKDLADIDLHNAFEIANYARKMLEAFFSFKHPKRRDNFYELMQHGCVKVGVEQKVIDRVYKFINSYSHHQVTGFDDSSVDNLLGESENITQHVLDIMSKADKVHYDELVEMCGE